MVMLWFPWWLAALLLVAPQKNDSTNQLLVKRHPFYIAVTEINQNVKDKTLEVSCKMFAEDLESILQKNYKTTLDLSSEKNKIVLDRLIADYIGKHLWIAVNGQPVVLKYLGFEKEKESAYCYFEVTGIPDINKVEVTNQILYDFNNSQVNIIHVVVKGKRQSMKLDYPEKLANFNF